MIEPGETDVLCIDRPGEQRKKLRGMVMFRGLLERNVEKFAQCKSLGEENSFGRSIIASIKRSGGRFLKRNKDTKQWYVVDDVKAQRWTIYQLTIMKDAKAKVAEGPGTMFATAASVSTSSLASSTKKERILAAPIPVKIPRKSGHSDKVGNRGGLNVSPPSKLQRNKEQLRSGRMLPSQFSNLVRTASGAGKGVSPVSAPFSPKEVSRPVRREEMGHSRKLIWSPSSPAKGSVSTPTGSSSRRSLSSNTPASLPSRKRRFPASIVDKIPLVPDMAENSSQSSGRPGHRQERTFTFPSSIGWKQNALKLKTASRAPLVAPAVVTLRDDEKGASKRLEKNAASLNAVAAGNETATGQSSALASSASLAAASALQSDGKSDFEASSGVKKDPLQSSASSSSFPKLRKKPAHVDTCMQNARVGKIGLGVESGKVNQYDLLKKIARPSSVAGFDTQKGGRWKKLKNRSLSISETSVGDDKSSCLGDHSIDHNGCLGDADTSTFGPEKTQAPTLPSAVETPQPSPKDGAERVKAKPTRSSKDLCNESQSVTNAPSPQEEEIFSCDRMSAADDLLRGVNNRSSVNKDIGPSSSMDAVSEPGDAGKAKEAPSIKSKRGMAAGEHSPRKRHRNSSTSTPGVSCGQDMTSEAMAAKNDALNQPLELSRSVEQNIISQKMADDEQQNKIVSTIVGIDGIVLVRPQQLNSSSLPSLPPWPARIANSLESEECLQDYWEAGKNISRSHYVCVYIYFSPPALPHKEGVRESAPSPSPTNGPESHREFVHLSRLRPFIEGELDKVFRSCALSGIALKEVEDQFKRSWNVAAGLRRWALGSEMLGRGKRDQRQGKMGLKAHVSPVFPHEQVGNYGVVFAVQKNDWKVAAEKSPEAVLDLILANKYVKRFTTHSSRLSLSLRDARNEEMIRQGQYFEDDGKSGRSNEPDTSDDSVSAFEPAAAAEAIDSVDGVNDRIHPEVAVSEKCKLSDHTNHESVSTASVEEELRGEQVDDQLVEGEVSTSKKRSKEAPVSLSRSDLSLHVESTESMAKTADVQASEDDKESSFASILKMMDEDESDQISPRQQVSEEGKKQKDGSFELDSVVGADGIVMVSGQDMSRSIHRPWPARVVCARESDERRLTFKRDGKLVDPNKVCIFYFFPCWGGVDGAAVPSPEAAKDRWYHLDFVHPSRLSPFVDDAIDLNGVPDDIVERFKRGWTVAAGLKFWSLGAAFSNRRSMTCKRKLKDSNSVHLVVRDYGPVLTIDDERWIEESASHDPDRVVQMINSSLNSRSCNFQYNERRSKELRGDLGMNFSRLCHDDGKSVSGNQNGVSGRRPSICIGGQQGVVGEKASAESNQLPARAHDLFHVVDEGRRSYGAMTNGGGMKVKREQSGSEPSAAADSHLWGELFTISSLGAKFAQSTQCAESKAIFEDLERVDPDVGVRENGLTVKIQRACKRILEVEEENARLKLEIERMKR